MIDPAIRTILWGLVLYLLTALALLFVRLMPVAPGAPSWPGPDILLGLTLVWVLRRPDQVPAPAIAMVGLIEDLVVMRPPGLWAVILLWGSETARTREGRWREQGFVVEWLRVSMLMGMMMLVERIVLVIFLLPVPPLGMVLLQLIATIACYPVIVLVGRSLLGVRRMSMAEAERLGYR